jgi:hypothetical protein
MEIKTKRHGRPWHDKRQQCNERQRCRKVEGGNIRRGDLTTSQTRGARGDGMERGMMRGNSTMRGRVTGRWELVARGEATQQPAGQAAREAMAQQEAMAQ